MHGIREDIFEVFDHDFEVLASPGGALTGSERVGIAAAARSGETKDRIQEFARHLYKTPASVTADDVAAAALGDYAPVIEVVGIVARLSANDRFHEVMGLDQTRLPDPTDEQPTGEIRHDLMKRRAHVPMPPGAIPVALDMVPAEGEALRAMFGPLYMTEDEMTDPHFSRSPGLNTPQLETIAARISQINECFY